MGFAKGKQTKEVEFKLYTGVAPVFIAGVNMTKDELESTYGREFEKEPEYLGTDNDGNKQARIEFVLRTDEENCGVDIYTRMSIFLSATPEKNKEGSKVHVIDKYGRTAWVTLEQAKNHEIPVYKNGPALIDKDYRAAFVGEVQLTELLKTFLGIPNVLSYKDGKWVANPNVNPEDCEARLDVETFKKIFNGDFSELKAIVNYQPENKIKVLFGVNTKDDRQYQTVYSRKVFPYNVTNKGILDLAAEIDMTKSNGGLATTEFTFDKLQEYKVTPTPLESKVSEIPENPFDDLDMPLGL